MVFLLEKLLELNFSVVNFSCQRVTQLQAESAIETEPLSHLVNTFMISGNGYLSR